MFKKIYDIHRGIKKKKKSNGSKKCRDLRVKEKEILNPVLTASLF